MGAGNPALSTEEMKMEKTPKWFTSEKGYGFIQVDYGDPRQKKLTDNEPPSKDKNSKPTKKNVVKAKKTA
jgi:hypothetical protein